MHGKSFKQFFYFIDEMLYTLLQLIYFMCEMKLQYLNERSALPNPKEIIVCYRRHSYATTIIIECVS